MHFSYELLFSSTILLKQWWSLLAFQRTKREMLTSILITLSQPKYPEKNRNPHTKKISCMAIKSSFQGPCGNE